jgi:COMPASS (Complex proteins associated with Set1p) component shg1
MANLEEGAPSDKQEATAAPTMDVESLQRKKYKTSELPLTQDQQTTIQNLLVAFKKKGAFDNYRKKIWAEFNESVCISAYQSPTLVLIGALRAFINPPYV